MKVLTIALFVTIVPPVMAGEPIWRRAPDGQRWEYVNPEYGQWKREPTGNRWHWVTPDDDWRRDPNGKWQVIPKGD